MTVRRPPARHADPIARSICSRLPPPLCSSPPGSRRSRRSSPADPTPRRRRRCQPTIQYEEAIAHADDRIDFTPGGRVTVPFKPRGERPLGGRWRSRRRPCRPGACPASARDPRRRAEAREAGSRPPRRRSAGPAVGRADVPYVAPGDVDPGRPRRGRRSGRAPSRGLRLPAVLGADRQLDPARLGEALDDRLLRRRRGRQRRPPEEEQRRHDDRRLERLDELEDDRRHQRRPRQRRPGSC